MNEKDRLERLARVLASVNLDEAPPGRLDPGDGVLGDIERQVNRLIELVIARGQERLLFERGPIVVIRWRNTPEWPVEYVSSNVEELLGYRPEELVSGAVNYAGLVHPDDMERVKGESLGYKRGLRRWSHEPYRLLRRDGRYIWISDETIPIQSAEGDDTHYFGYLSDISEQMERQGDLERSADDLRRIVNPVLQVWDGVLAMPVLGAVDAARAAHMTEKLLGEVAARRASFAVLDLTGLEEIDAGVMERLSGMIRATALLGCQCVLSGVSPQAARLIVELGIDLGSVATFATLQGALAFAVRSF